MTLKKNSHIHLPLLVGLFIFSFFLHTIAITTLLFVFKISITSFNVIAALTLSVITCFSLSGKDWKKTLTASGVGFVLLLVSVLWGWYIDGHSWDGCAYHIPMNAFLKNGWNPLYETFYSFADNHFPILSGFDSNYLDAYPKGSEILSACIYAITNDVQTGKYFNLLATAGTFLLCYSFLVDVVHLRKWQGTTIAFFLAGTPVAWAQISTFLNDAFLWHTVLLCTIAVLYLTVYEKGTYSSVAYYVIFAMINIGFNIKFSGIIFFAIPCGIYFIYWFCKAWKNGWTAENRKLIGCRFSLMAGSVVSGTLFTGATSYVINIIRHNNPLYSIFGEGANEIIEVFMPSNYIGKSNFYRFFHSMFSRVGKPEIKFPLTFTGAEVDAARWGEPFVGGWGLLFSGILIVSIVVLVIAYFKVRTHRAILCRIAEVSLLGVVLAIAFVPGMNWARYNGVPFYIPCCALTYLFLKANSKASNATTQAYVSGILIALLTINITPTVFTNWTFLKNADQDLAEMKKLKAISEHSDLEVSCYDPYHKYNFYGRLFPLYDNGITNFVYNFEGIDDPTGSVFSSYKIYYKANKCVQDTNTLETFIAETKEHDDALLIVAAKDEASSALTNSIVQTMQGLGLEFPLQEGYRSAYIAVLDCNKNIDIVYEEMSQETLRYSGKIGGLKLSVVSSGYEQDNLASICVNGHELALNRRGLNLVLYDKKNKVVLDSIAVDTYESNELTR